MFSPCQTTEGDPPFAKRKDSIHPYLFNAVRGGEEGREGDREKKNFATYGVLLTTNQQTVGDWGRGRQVGSNQS